MCLRPVVHTIFILTMMLSSHQALSWNEEEGVKEEALALTPNAKDGKKLYGTCALCHMPEGWGTATGTFPQIAGQHHQVLIKQLADIREGNRDNPTMYPFALQERLGGAQAVADVTAYIAALPMSGQNETGPGFYLEKGEKLYEHHCVACHGERGEGHGPDFIPRIQGQHYHYVLRQMRWIKSGKRRNANPKMVRQINDFTDRDLQAISDYVSRLPPDPELLAKPNWRNQDFQWFRRGGKLPTVW